MAANARRGGVHGARALVFVIGYLSYHKGSQPDRLTVPRWLIMTLVTALIMLSCVAVYVILNARHGG